MIRSKKRQFTRGEREDDGFPKIFKKKYCRFCQDKTHSMEIGYKNLGTLEKMISERGKILSRRVTGNCARHQREICSAIKRARFLSFIPFTR